MSPGRAEQDRLGRIGFPIAAFVLPLVVYLLTWCRDIFRLDTTELMLSGICLRLPHPPGYPLLILLLRLVSLVPILGTPLRMNMAAALYAALTWGLSFELWQPGDRSRGLLAPGADHLGRAVLPGRLVPDHLAAVVVIGAGFAWLYGRNRMVAAGTGVLFLALPLLVFLPRRAAHTCTAWQNWVTPRSLSCPQMRSCSPMTSARSRPCAGSSRTAESGPMYGS